MRYASILVPLVFLLSGCDDNPMITGSNPDSTDLLNIEVEAPEQVEQGSTFEMVVTVENESNETVEVTTPHSCLYNSKVYKDEEHVHFEGTQWACLTVVTTHKIEAGEKKRDVHEITAKEYGSSSEAEPAGEGEYELVIKSETEELDEVSATFEVTEPSADASADQ